MGNIKKVRFNTERCKGCELCTAVCPKNIIKMADGINNKGYNYAVVEEQAECISCGLCALVCPDIVIEVYKED